MTYYLLDHPNPNAPVRADGQRGFFYPSRRRPILAIVVHITAGLEDLDLAGVDTSAEATAAYAARTGRAVSWHAGTDSDSAVRLLPDGYTAFHVRGYNAATLGHEISKRDTSWADEPPAWVAATLARAAAVDAAWCAAHGIPIRRASRADLDAAIAAYDATGEVRPVGLVGHRDLDPSRRTDPGADFPWDRYLALVQARKDHGMLAYNDRSPAVAQLQHALNGLIKVTGGNFHGGGTEYANGSHLVADGHYGDKTAAAVDLAIRRGEQVLGFTFYPVYALDGAADTGTTCSALTQALIAAAYARATSKGPDVAAAAQALIAAHRDEEPHLPSPDLSGYVTRDEYAGHRHPEGRTGTPA